MSTTEAFTQKAWPCRCEWGPGAAAALAPADVTIVVDVLSFTTCVDVAVSRGAAILPYPWNDASAAAFARELYSLPNFWADVTADDVSRVSCPNPARIATRSDAHRAGRGGTARSCRRR